MASSIKETALKFTEVRLKKFSFCDHETGLLFGNVQAGKTAQMFGIMCAAADFSFPIFILLTTDNVTLQKQTYERVLKDLSHCNFCVCGELDKQKFIENQLKKPTIIVLKKNTNVLLQWYNTLASSSFVKGNALFIVDDEADAASLNTLVNKKQISTINSRLTNIQNLSIASIYLQVTGTPQAILLQSSQSNFKPSFTHYFAPGKSYLGGEFFFGEDKHAISFIDEKIDTCKDGLYHALLHHLVVSAQLFLWNEKVCNFVIHPGVKKAVHNTAKRRIEEKICYIKSVIAENDFKNDLIKTLESLCTSTKNKAPESEIYSKVKEIITGNDLKIVVMNADSCVTEKDYCNGSNIIIGGNVLGRGVTFPKLQTLYYTRTAKKPQADTMWQHSRMFGYDRYPGLMKVFLTKTLYTLFSHINTTNNSIIAQIERGLEKVQVFYPEGISATRKNVLDSSLLDMIIGGANYYPCNPDNRDSATLNSILNSFISETYYQVGLPIILKILEYIEPSEDFNLTSFTNVINAIIAQHPNTQGILIVRKDRAITQGTGSLLSPNDRLLGASFSSNVVLTMYQINGGFGWKRDNIWVPNIKMPDLINYYDVH